MAQTDLNLANASGAVFRADANDHLEALATLSSGSTAPSVTFPNLWWFDEANNILKQRNLGNTAWVLVAQKDGSGWRPYWNGAQLDTVFFENSVSATSRLLGRITAGAGAVEELTGAQATTLLDVFTDALKGLAPASGGGTTNFLRADGTWVEPASGITRGTAQAPSAASDVDFSIEAGANRVTLLIELLNMSGGNNLLVQLGDAGGIETTGYLGSVSTNSNHAAWGGSGGQLTATSTSTEDWHGRVVLTRIDGNSWSIDGTIANDDGGTSGADISLGSKTLSAELTTVRLATSGTDTITATKINVLVE